MLLNKGLNVVCIASPQPNLGNEPLVFENSALRGWHNLINFSNVEMYLK